MKKEDLIRLIIDAQTNLSSSLDTKTSRNSAKTLSKSAMSGSVDTTATLSDTSGVTADVSVSDSLLAQIKGAVVEAVRDLKNELHREHQAQMEDLEAKFSREVVALQTEITALKERVDLSFKNVEREFLKDLRETEQRKDNVMIFGLEESSAPSPSDARELDLAKVKCLSSALGVQNFKIRNCFRLGQRTNGRSRPIKITCHDPEQRCLFLRSAFHIPKLDASLGFHRVFVKPDLTPKEQEAERQLRLELKARQVAGENVRIRDGRIVMKESVQSSS